MKDIQGRSQDSQAVLAKCQIPAGRRKPRLAVSHKLGPFLSKLERTIEHM